MLMQAGWVVFSSVVLICILFGVLGLWIRNVEDKTGYILSDLAGVREQMEKPTTAISNRAYEFQNQLDGLKLRLTLIEQLLADKDGQQADALVVRLTETNKKLREALSEMGQAATIVQDLLKESDSE